MRSGRASKGGVDCPLVTGSVNLEEVKAYLAGQEEHHRKLSFQDELRALLRRHEIEWNERYVWD
jgi:hypothetical protein